MTDEDKQTTIGRIAEMIRRNHRNTDTPTYNDYSLATYLYNNGLGFVSDRPNLAGGAALRAAALALAGQPQPVVVSALRQAAAAAGDRGADEEAHALDDAAVAFAATVNEDRSSGSLGSRCGLK